MYDMLDFILSVLRSEALLFTQDEKTIVFKDETRDEDRSIVLSLSGGIVMHG